jgi:membrane complex biogenesis BtpA family protein
MPVFVPGGARKAVLGMIHLQPLPGTPFYQEDSLPDITATAVDSALALERGGASGCLVQTVDRVYAAGEESDPARTAAMALIVQAITQATGPHFQVGVQLMRNALTASLAVAKVAGGSYIRASALVGATMSASGLVQADPLRVMEYRKKINADDVEIIAEVDSMHFSWHGGGASTAQVAGYARYAGADAVSLGHPDEATTLEMIAAVRERGPGMPIILAGYTNHDNAARLLAAADGAFVGTCLEAGGWGGRIDPEKVKAYTDIVAGLED